MAALFERVSETRPSEQLPVEVMARLRRLLLGERRTKIDQAREQGRTVAELTAEPGAGVGQFEVDWDLAEDMVAWSHEAVEEIDDALARMDRGTYGICEQCAALIPLERLEAIPHARFCVSCQSRRDAMR